MKSQEKPDRKNIEECCICLQSIVKAVRCKGQCQKLFCLRCAARAKCQDDRCPSRCSSPFQVLPVELPFYCPFKPEYCLKQIKSQKDLEDHYLICPYLSEKERKELDNKAGFRCKKGHPLTFLPQEGLSYLYGKNWDEKMQKKCADCGQIELTRIICVECSRRAKHSYYCFECRVPPCTRNHCPLGHSLKSRYRSAKKRTCDQCGHFVLLTGKKFHRCQECDFDLCFVCNIKLSKSKKTKIRRWTRADTKLIE